MICIKTSVKRTKPLTKLKHWMNIYYKSLQLLLYKLGVCLELRRDWFNKPLGLVWTPVNQKWGIGWRVTGIIFLECRQKTIWTFRHLDYYFYGVIIGDIRILEYYYSTRIRITPGTIFCPAPFSTLTQRKINSHEKTPKKTRYREKSRGW